MSETAEAETPLSDHVARFWQHLRTETVRILVDLKRTVGTDAPDGPVIYWDGASFSDEVAKALVAERAELTRLRQANAALVEDMKRIKALAAGPHPPRSLEDLGDIFGIADSALASQ